MSRFKYKLKDKLIRIYREEQGGTVKHYIHPETTYLKAYVRQLSATEQNTANALQDRSDIEFVINKREIAPDMYVEFKGKTYQIGSPDNYEFYNTEVKFRAYEVNPKTYSQVTFEVW